MSNKNKFTRANVSLTQDKIVDFIHKYTEKKGYPPSVRNICEGTGIKSTSTVHTHLKKLNESGRINYVSGRRRAISIVKNDDGTSEFDNNNLNISNNVVNIPLVGTVTAGAPILAVENIETTLPLPSDFIRSKGDVFALKIKGDSMKDVAILDGDYVIVQKQNYAKNGDIVVALIEDEATVKTFKIIKGIPWLKPENPNYDLIPYDENRSSILGRVISVFRSKV